jgi:hypothetical protein
MEKNFFTPFFEKGHTQILTDIINSDNLDLKDKKALLLSPQDKLNSKNALHLAAEKKIFDPIQAIIDGKNFSLEDKIEFLHSKMPRGKRILDLALKNAPTILESILETKAVNITERGTKEIISDMDFMKKALFNEKMDAIHSALHENNTKPVLQIIYNESLSFGDRKTLLDETLVGYNEPLKSIANKIVTSKELTPFEKLSFLNIKLKTPNTTLLKHNISLDNTTLIEKILKLPEVNGKYREDVKSLLTTPELNLSKKIMSPLKPSLLRLGIDVGKVDTVIFKNAVKEAIDINDLTGLQHIASQHNDFAKNRDIKVKDSSNNDVTLLEYAKKKFENKNDKTLLDKMSDLGFDKSRSSTLSQASKFFGKLTSKGTSSTPDRFKKKAPKNNYYDPGRDFDDGNTKYQNNPLLEVDNHLKPSAPPHPIETLKTALQNKYDSAIDSIIEKSSSVISDKNNEKLKELQNKLTFFVTWYGQNQSHPQVQTAILRQCEELLQGPDVNSFISPAPKDAIEALKEVLKDPKHSTTLDKLNSILHEKPFEINDKDHKELKLQLIKLGEMSQNPKFAAFKDRIPSIVDSHIQNLLEPKSSEISR